MLWLGFTLMNLQQLRILARVPIISAYDPRRESMLAYASPSNRIAIVITGLVTQSIAQGQFHNSYHHFSTLAIFTLLFIYLNNAYFLFTYSLLSCKSIQQHLQSTSSFILVLGKANVKHAQSCIGGRQNLREYLFYLQLLVGFDTLTYRKSLQLISYTCGLSVVCCRGIGGGLPPPNPIVGQVVNCEELRVVFICRL